MMEPIYIYVLVNEDGSNAETRDGVWPAYNSQDEALAALQPGQTIVRCQFVAQYKGACHCSGVWENFKGERLYPNKGRPSRVNDQLAHGCGPEGRDHDFNSGRRFQVDDEEWLGCDDCLMTVRKEDYVKYEGNPPRDVMRYRE